MSTRILNYVYVVHYDCIVRNGWAFNNEVDAQRVKDILSDYYKEIYSYRPYVFSRTLITLENSAEDEIIMNSQRYTLSEVNRRIDALKAALDFAETPKEVLLILGEEPIPEPRKNKYLESLMCLFYCCTSGRNLSYKLPKHYLYSLHKRIYTGTNIHSAEINR